VPQVEFLGEGFEKQGFVKRNDEVDSESKVIAWVWG
jgi:hypothetical protein